MAEPKKYQIDPADNRRVVNDLRNGSEECFDAVYRYYYRGLCAYASQYVMPHHAEEIVQDTMMWLWENRTTLIADLSLRALLFMIVKNRSLNRISHNRIKDRVHGVIAAKFDADFDNPDLYMENELFERFSAAMLLLPEDLRATFMMHRMEGMTHRQIADVLGVAPQTVNYRIGKAVRMLRGELKDFLPLIL